MEEPLTNIESWERYGLSGLVILALFITLGWFLRRLMTHHDEQSKQHADERAEWRTFAEVQTKMHHNERMEWRKDIERFDQNMENRDQKLQNTLNTLTTLIHPPRNPER